MKILKILAGMSLVLTILSMNASATTTRCTNTDASGSFVINFDSLDHSGTIEQTVNGSSNVALLLHAYIMNDSIPGNYYYEGLAKVPNSDADARFFSIKLNPDNTEAVLKVSDVGGANAVFTTVKNCTVKYDPVHW